jgi:hypothetical protein
LLDYGSCHNIACVMLSDYSSNANACSLH